MRLGDEARKQQFRGPHRPAAAASASAAAAAMCSAACCRWSPAASGSSASSILLLGYCALTQLAAAAAAACCRAAQHDQRAGGPIDARPEHRSDFLTARARLDRGHAGARSSPRAGSATRRRRWSPIRGGTQSGCGAARRRWGRSTARPTSRSTSTRVLQRAVAALPGARRLRPGLCHRARGRPPRPGPRRHARPGAQRSQARASETEGNAIQVKVELQADCYAGVWAAKPRDAQGSILEPGDVEEGMRAAEAIGDDTLQKQTQGVVVPESFTHGTSAQRMEALQRGLQDRRPGRLQVALEPDQHLAGVGAAEQAEEGVGHRSRARRRPSRAT